MACLSRPYHFKFLKASLNKLYLVHSWILSPIFYYTLNSITIIISIVFIIINTAIIATRTIVTCFTIIRIINFRVNYHSYLLFVLITITIILSTTINFLISYFIIRLTFLICHLSRYSFKAGSFLFFSSFFFLDTESCSNNFHKNIFTFFI